MVTFCNSLFPENSTTILIAHELIAFGMYGYILKTKESWTFMRNFGFCRAEKKSSRATKNVWIHAGLNP